MGRLRSNIHVFYYGRKIQLDFVTYWNNWSYTHHPNPDFATSAC